MLLILIMIAPKPSKINAEGIPSGEHEHEIILDVIRDHTHVRNRDRSKTVTIFNLIEVRALVSFYFGDECFDSFLQII